jgi:hypothetical protein
VHLQVSLEWCDGVRLAALSKGGGPGEAQFAVTADGIRSANPSSKLLRPPRPVEAALAPPQLQRWPDAAAAPCADGLLRPSRAAGARHETGARGSELQQQRRRDPAAATAARTIK